MAKGWGCRTRARQVKEKARGPQENSHTPEGKGRGKKTSKKNKEGSRGTEKANCSDSSHLNRSGDEQEKGGKIWKKSRNPQGKLRSEEKEVGKPESCWGGSRRRGICSSHRRLDRKKREREEGTSKEEQRDSGGDQKRRERMRGHKRRNLT